MTGRRAGVVAIDTATVAESNASRPTTGTASTSAHPIDDIRKRMADIFTEMEQHWRRGRFRLPLKFVNFYQSDVMYVFVRAAVGYSLAFVKVRTLEKDLHNALQYHTRLENELSLSTSAPDCSLPLQVDDYRSQLTQAAEVRTRCSADMSAAYSRLVLHCSNFENHKEDERFFECVYFFVCSVAKLSVASDHWRPVEEELGFLFRGAQFSSNVKSHSRAPFRLDGRSTGSSVSDPTNGLSNGSSIQRSNTSTDGKLNASTVGGGRADSGISALLSAGGSTLGGSTGGGASGSVTTGGIMSPSSTSGIQNGAGGTVSSKIHNLSPTAAKGSPRGRGGADGNMLADFSLPKSRITDFPESVPVKKIVSNLEATKSRVAHNMEIAQALRDQLTSQRSEAQRRRLEAILSPRQSMHVGHAVEVGGPKNLPVLLAAGPGPSPRSLVSPRVTMRCAFTTRSPALNNLLPPTEERVRMALDVYERDLQARREQQALVARRPPGGGGRRFHSGGADANGTCSPTPHGR